MLFKEKSILNLQSSYSKGVRNVFLITSFIILAGNIIDIVKFSQINNFIVLLNLVNVAVVMFALILFFFRRSTFKADFTIVAYSIFLNILIGKFFNSFEDTDPMRVNFYLRDSLFIIFILTTASFAINKIHSLIMGIAYIAFSIIFAYVVKSEYLFESLIQIIFVTVAYIVLTYYLVSIFEKALIDLQEKNKLIGEQNDYLSETNTRLEERQQIIEEQSQAIEFQSHKLQFQSDELKLKNEELAKLNASKDMFISIIAHDLKNPFNIVLGYSEMLLKNFQTLSDEKKIKCIDYIHSTSIKIYNLFENLLSWSFSQSDQLSVKPENISLNSITKEVVDLYGGLLKEKAIELSLPKNGEYFAFADKHMISLVIRNILSNAIKFTPETGKIQVHFFDSENFVECEIKDTGIGIDDEVIPVIFNIDKHHLNPGTDGEKGTGLGLKLSKVFIEKNNGKIRVTSKKNEGTSFIISIPKKVNS